MTTNKKDPVLVILQMSGAYDALNTFIPYSDPHYADYRQVLRIPPEEVLAVDDKVGFHPAMAPKKICTTRVKWRSFRVLDILIQLDHTSVQWTYGIRRNRIR